MPDLLAIVSKTVFERDARVSAKTVTPGIVWPIDRYTSTTKPFQVLKDGGRIFLVTVRPPSEELWLVGVVEAPTFDGTAWVARAPNKLPVTDISRLRKTLRFESGKGLPQDKGTLGMSLQTPRTLTADDVAQLLGAVAGEPVKDVAAFARTEASAPDVKARIIDGKYEIRRALGAGGMGVVYEARHTTTGRRVAVKEIVSGMLEKDPDLVARFQREASVTGEIESQHIAMVLDAGTDPATGNPYLVMELLHGEDLQQLLVRRGPLPEDIALRVCAQACAGLIRAHAAGVVHRDIKPANLFLARRDGDAIVVKLLDFGIARVRDAAEHHRALTSTGLMLGTPLYMSPEQVRGPKHVDHRSDVWSLGVVLYEMLTGRTPHGDEETVGGLLVAICATPAPKLVDAVPRVSDPVAAIVAKALAIDPKLRYATTEELLADLDAELPRGNTLDESMFGWLPASVRADASGANGDATELALGLAATAAQEGVAPDGTLRSKEAPSGMPRKPVS